MTRYNTFLCLFILGILAFLFFIGFYMKGFFTIMMHAQDFAESKPNPADIFSTIFSPAVIISFIIVVAVSITNRVIGIVAVAKSKTVSDGEKAMWIVGFVLMSFITSIVFLIMARGKGFME